MVFYFNPRTFSLCFKPLEVTFIQRRRSRRRRWGSRSEEDEEREREEEEEDIIKKILTQEKHFTETTVIAPSVFL